MVCKSLPVFTSFTLNPTNLKVAILFDVDVCSLTNVSNDDTKFPLDTKSISWLPYLYLQFLKETF